jgi:hypothetical protein
LTDHIESGFGGVIERDVAKIARLVVRALITRPLEITEG